MRLLDLTLDSYGPFAGLRLEFDPQAQVHIVYGANEAGKSSALAALGDLFYGAPRREKISFLRPKDLRLGATLRGRNGQILQFFRRRGDKNTLLDASGAALPDDALAPFLGAATREIFHRAFGLDSASPARRAATTCCARTARSARACSPPPPACAACSTCATGLDDEAEKIFDDRRAGHRAFYQALDRFEAARKQEKDALVSDSDAQGSERSRSRPPDSNSRTSSAPKRTRKPRRCGWSACARPRRSSAASRVCAPAAAQYDDLAGHFSRRRAEHCRDARRPRRGAPRGRTGARLREAALREGRPRRRTPRCSPKRRKSRT